MSYYKICSFCGCNLDPGESCDCRLKENKKNVDNFLKIRKGQQIESDLIKRQKEERKLYAVT